MDVPSRQTSWRYRDPCGSSSSRLTPVIDWPGPENSASRGLLPAERISISVERSGCCKALVVTCPVVLSLHSRTPKSMTTRNVRATARPFLSTFRLLLANPQLRCSDLYMSAFMLALQNLLSLPGTIELPGHRSQPQSHLTRVLKETLRRNGGDSVGGKTKRDGSEVEIQYILCTR